MATVNIYLTFNGNCEAAFNFYKSVFGGDFPYIGRFKDMPPGEDGGKLNPEDANRIMHVSLPISKETMLLGSDTGGEWGANFLQGNNFSISVTADNKEEAEKLNSYTQINIEFREGIKDVLNRLTPEELSDIIR